MNISGVVGMKKRITIFFSVMAVVLLVFSSVSLAAAKMLVKQGSCGENVRQVQELLIEKGFLNGAADGICGKQTVAAIKSFQKENHLDVDGICGPATFEVLKNAEHHKATEHKPHKGDAVYVEATGYSAHDPGNNPHTASGTLVRHGVIAVDPSFIPLGSRVLIPGYGEAVAEDIGWGIRGNLIDIAFDTHEEALSFGRQELEIYILEYGE